MSEKSVVIITGAARGIGRATALKFAAHGYALALVDIDGGALNDVKEKIGNASGGLIHIEGDLQSAEFLRTVVQRTVDTFGRIDVLINNAAWRTIETMRAISMENWDKTFRINVTAPAFLAKYAAAVMEEKRIPGVVINISSVMSQRTGGTSPAYVACKGAIESLTYELAVLYGPKGIRVVAVNPGNIETESGADYKDEKGNNIGQRLSDHMNESTPLGRGGSAEEIANVCHWLCTRDASFITGTTLVVDGGFQHSFNSYQIKKLQFPKEF